MQRSSSFAALAFAALLLAGCGLPPPKPAGDAHMSWYEKYPNWKPGDPWPDESGAPSAAPELPAKPAATAKPPGESASQPQRQATLPPVAPGSRAPNEPPPEPPKLDELRGLNAAQLTAMLGKPTLMRDEATAEMWQYRGETCVLHLFLYPSGASGGEKRVQYVEARQRQTGAPAVTSGPSECLATLVGARRLRS